MEILHALFRNTVIILSSVITWSCSGGGRRLRLILTPVFSRAGSGLGRANAASGKIKLRKHKGHLYEMQRMGRNILLRGHKRCHGAERFAQGVLLPREPPLLCAQPGREEAWQVFRESRYN